MFIRDVKAGAPPAEYDTALLWSGRAGLLALGCDGLFIVDRDCRSQPRDRPAAGVYLLRHRCPRVSLLLAAVAFQFPLRFWQQQRLTCFYAAPDCLRWCWLPASDARSTAASAGCRCICSPAASELMKLFVVLYAADYTVRKAAYMHQREQRLSAAVSRWMLVIGWLCCASPIRRARGGSA